MIMCILVHLHIDEQVIRVSLFSRHLELFRWELLCILILTEVLGVEQFKKHTVKYNHFNYAILSEGGRRLTTVFHLFLTSG